MTYIDTINAAILKRIEHADRLVCFGQNISTGSFLSGLTRGLRTTGNVEVINTPNCENGLVGFGFGLMMEGVNSIFFVKQLDFLLLTTDQLVNTWNMARLGRSGGSFTIIPIVVDSGYEGPQSRLNNLSDFSSIADFPCFALADAEAATHIIEEHLITPGFRILAPSQRLFRQDAGPAHGRAVPCHGVDGGTEIFHLGDGDDATVVAFNFSWPQARRLAQTLEAEGMGVDLFGVAATQPSSWQSILASVQRTRRLVILDDSRARNRPADRLRSEVTDAGFPHDALAVYRPIRPEDIPPNPDLFEVDDAAILSWIRQEGHAP